MHKLFSFLRANDQKKKNQADPTSEQNGNKVNSSEGRECEDLIGTHCSWEELHLSQVLVTTQMICRYYWNLGGER